MRYILNDSGYIQAVSFNNLLECQNKTCTEYTGTIPTGYENLAEWSENANINAYKIVEGNLVFDSDEDTRLQNLWTSQKANGTGGATNTNNYSTEEQVIGTWIDGKPLYRKTFINSFDQIEEYEEILLNDIDDAFLLFGYVKGSGGSKIGFETGSKEIRVNTSNQMLIRLTGGMYVAYNATVVYTKTTD